MEQNKQLNTEKSETTWMINKNRIKYVLASFFISILLAIVFILPFIHSKYQKLTEWTTYKEHYASHSQIISDSNSERLTLIKKLENRDITIEQFVINARNLESIKTTDLEVYHNKKNALKKEYSFLGYSSFRYFLYAIGLPIFSLGASIFLLIFVLNPNHVKYLKRFYILACSGFIYVSLYWVLHSFLTRVDFPEWAYNGSFSFLAILSSTLIIILVSFFSSRKGVINKLIGLVINIKEKHYPKVLAKALYAENNGNDLPALKSTKNLANDFDDDVISTFKSIE